MSRRSRRILNLAVKKTVSCSEEVEEFTLQRTSGQETPAEDSKSDAPSLSPSLEAYLQINGFPWSASCQPTNEDKEQKKKPVCTESFCDRPSPHQHHQQSTLEGKDAVSEKTEKVSQLPENVADPDAKCREWLTANRLQCPHSDSQKKFLTPPASTLPKHVLLVQYTPSSSGDFEDIDVSSAVNGFKRKLDFASHNNAVNAGNGKHTPCDTGKLSTHNLDSPKLVQCAESGAPPSKHQLFQKLEANGNTHCDKNNNEQETGEVLNFVVSGSGELVQTSSPIFSKDCSSELPVLPAPLDVNVVQLLPAPSSLSTRLIEGSGDQDVLVAVVHADADTEFEAIPSEDFLGPGFDESHDFETQDSPPLALVSHSEQNLDPAAGDQQKSKRKAPKQAVRTPGKKRSRNISRWIANQAKQARSAGLAYTSKQGKVFPAKIMRKSCGSACKFRCSSKNFGR